MLGQIEKIKNNFKLYVNELLLIFFFIPIVIVTKY